MDGPEQRTAFPLSGDFLAGRRRDDVPVEDLAAIEEMLGQPRSLADGECLIARGEPALRASLLIEGFMFDRIVKDDKRHIVGVHVPGDFVDLHGFALKHLDHDIVAAGTAKIVQVERERLREVSEARPSVARALWFATLLDAAINRQWIRNLEALDASQRIAHLYAELHHRLSLIGRNVSRTLRTPFTQTDLADMCGVSAIHANRAVARIRELGLGEIRRGDMYMPAWAELERYAQFDARYLYGDRLTR